MQEAVHKVPVVPDFAVPSFEALAADPLVREIWMYGSRANGMESESSDCDFIVFAMSNAVCRPRGNPKVDVLWVGPNSNALADGAGHDRPFLDYCWQPSEDGTANYVGIVKLKEEEHGVATDVELRPPRPKLKAFRLWPAPR